MFHASYKSVVEGICGEGWDIGDVETYNGGVGVAIMLSYLRGVKPSLNELSEDIGIPVNSLSSPFRRLLVSGIFSKKFDARHDSELIGRDFSSTNIHVDGYPLSSSTTTAWCHVAGIASGLLIRNYDCFHFDKE